MEGKIMTTKEMKEILAKKLKDENTYFTMLDISIKKKANTLAKGKLVKTTLIK